MLGSWGWEEKLELGEGTTTPTRERQRRESPDSTHPVPDSRVLRYAPSRCHHPPSYSSPFNTQPSLYCTDCEYTLLGLSRNARAIPTTRICTTKYYASSITLLEISALIIDSNHFRLLSIVRIIFW